MPRPHAVVFWYSQTGQLRRVAEAFAGGLERAGWRVSLREVAPAAPYPFPWTLPSVFKVFPPTVLGVAPDVRVDELPPDARLVILAYQVWYLAPSLPIQAFLARHAGELRGVPVISLIACRSMWYSAERKVRETLRRAGARHVGTVVAVDQGSKWLTFVTTPRWLLTGRSDRFLGVFPPAGVSDARVDEVARLAARLRPESIDEAERELRPPAAYRVDFQTALADVVGDRLFVRCARLFAGVRRPLRRVGLTLFALCFPLILIVGIPPLLVGRLLARHAVDRRLARYLGLEAPDALERTGAAAVEDDERPGVP